MRIQHTLWRVSNGWLLVPEKSNGIIADIDAPACFIFKTLKEFSEWTPKRERRRRTRKEILTEFQKGSKGGATLTPEGKITCP
jgi:hypothetical protein